MSIPAHILVLKRDALLAHCSAKYPVFFEKVDANNHKITAGTTELGLALTGGGMHVSVRKTTGPPLGSHALEGLKHGLLTSHSQLIPSISVDVNGRDVRQVWLKRDDTLPGVFWLSAVTTEDIAKVEAVVIAMIRLSSR